MSDLGERASEYRRGRPSGSGWTERARDDHLSVADLCSMLVLSQGPGSTVKEVHDSLGRGDEVPWSYVRSYLTRLHGRGFVRRWDMTREERIRRGLGNVKGPLYCWELSPSGAERMGAELKVLGPLLRSFEGR